MPMPSCRVSGSLNLAVGLWSLKIKCNQRLVANPTDGSRWMVQGSTYFKADFYLRIPPTAVGGWLKSSLSSLLHCDRLDFKYLPTAVGGITLSRHCHVGWTLSIHRLPSVGLL